MISDTFAAAFRAHYLCKVQAFHTHKPTSSFPPSLNVIFEICTSAAQNMARLGVLLYRSITDQTGRQMDSCLALSQCEGQYSKKGTCSSGASTLEGRHSIRAHPQGGGDFYLSKQNSIASLKPLLITGLGQNKGGL